MTQISKGFSILVIVIFGGMFTNFTFGQSVSSQENRILIYDGASDPRSFSALLMRILPAEKSPDNFTSARRRILGKSSQIKKVGLNLMQSIESMKTSVNCQKFDTDEVIVSSIGGTFTKANAKQTAYLYKIYFCDEDKKPQEEYADLIGGILIVENGEIAANYVYAGFRFSQIKALPDINQNGLSEIVLARDYNDIDLVEITGNQIKVSGNFKEIHSYNGGLDGIPYTYISKKIYAVPGKNPEFFQESYFKRGSDEWKSENLLEKVSPNSSGDWTNFFQLVK